MRDWKAIAKAREIDISPEAMDRTIAPLDEVEEILRSMVRDLKADVEPAFEVHLEEGE